MPLKAPYKSPVVVEHLNGRGARVSIHYFQE